MLTATTDRSQHPPSRFKQGARIGYHYLALWLFVALVAPSASGNVVTGELRVWHRVSVSFTGPQTSETAAVNPFSDYRLNVTFTHAASGAVYIVPGFYAADGNAAESSAVSGATWRVHFVPDRDGVWTYTASFRTGAFVAISDLATAGVATSFDGASGSFTVLPTNKTGVDYRGKGLLRYVGGHHYQFAGNGEYYIKTGADTPENLLAYADFDGTFDTVCNTEPINNSIHYYTPHVDHWTAGDPTWKSTKGKGLIGGLNYLSSVGVNSVYFLTYNLDGGDGCDVWPWTTNTVRDRFDVSKLEQWEKVFSHMDAKGIQLHMVLSERQNGKAIGPIGGADNSGLNDIRKLYYRELAARFSHHLALQWNLGEENTNTDPQKREFAAFIRKIDPYDHPITVHTGDGAAFDYYDARLGDPAFEATSLQALGTEYNALAIHHRTNSAQAGRKWAVYGDEQAPNAGNERADELRKGPLWGNLMGGGAGVEWYTAFDLGLEDWSRFFLLWEQMRYARTFFETHLPFEEMEPMNALTVNVDDFVFGKDEEMYAVYLPAGGTALLNLAGVSGTFDVFWYNPRTGGELKTSSVQSVVGGAIVSLGLPPSETNNDWVALVKSTDAPANLPPVASFTYGAEAGNPLTVLFNGSSSSDPDGTIVSHHWTFGDGKFVTETNPAHTYAAAGTYEISLTVTDDDGAIATVLGSVSVSSSTNLPLVSLSITAFTSAEPGGTGNNGKIQVARTGDLSLPVTVQFAFGGVAVMGVDYEAINDNLTLSAGDNISNFAVKPIDDVLFEGTESVIITLLPGAGYAIDPLAGVVLLDLLDNDSATDLDPLYRVNAGGNAESDEVLVWDRDTKNKPSDYVNAGTGDNATNRYTFNGVNNTSAPTGLFGSRRWDPAGSAEMQWDFSVSLAGLYDIRLYFAETDNATDAPGDRIFDVSIEGAVVLDNYDVVADVGMQTAVMQRFVVNVSDGNIDIDFGHVYDNPFVSAIEILPTAGTSTGSTSVGDRPAINRSFAQVIGEDWSLVGVPIAVNAIGMPVPQEQQQALAYEGASYLDVRTLVAGRGYWMRAETDLVRAFDGLRMDSVAVAVEAGWNLIAGPSCSVDIDAIDGGDVLVPETLYAYSADRGYHAMRRLEQGVGYWVMARADGELHMVCHALATTIEPVEADAALESFGQLRLSDANGASQLLFFGGEMDDAAQLRHALPPKPPADMFDARFSNQGGLSEATSAIIELRSSAFPIQLDLDRLPRVAGGEYVVTLLKGGREVEDIHVSAGEPVLIEDFTVEALKLQPADQWAAALPEAFSVSGNFPNPFTASTAIVMDLPDAADVAVEVFDLIGRRVASVPAQALDAGRGRRVEIDADGLASGVYLYRVEALMPGHTATYSGKMIVRR